MNFGILAYYCFIYHLLQICLPHYWQARDLVHDSFISGNVSSVYTDGVYRASVRGDLYKNRRSAMSKTCRRHCSILWTEEISFLGWFWGVCIHEAWKTEAIYYSFVCSNSSFMWSANSLLSIPLASAVVMATGCIFAEIQLKYNLDLE